MADRYRLDDPVSEAFAAVSALTPDQLRDCSVEVRHAGDAAAPWVEVFSPRDNPVPVVRIELPADQGARAAARMLTLRFLHELAGVCRGERYVT